MDINLLTSLSENIRIDRDKCTGCGRCVEVCVLDNLRLQLSPCRQACPLGVNCQGYIRQIVRGNHEDGVVKIREKVPFAGILSRVCSHPCEAQCNRTQVDGQAVAIRNLKRYLADAAPPPEPPLITETGKKAAVVGAGPAGMTAAYDLRAAGLKVSLFDKEPAPGGLLRHAIPEFRLPRDVLERDLAVLPAMGVEFHGNRTLGQDLRLEDLEKEFDAVILALGCYGRARLDVPGEEAAEVFHVLDFMKHVQEKRELPIGERVVVVGGGNAAVDAAQTALRLGAKAVHLISMEERAQMPAIPQSVTEAEEEGVAVQNGWGPQELRLEDGRLKGVTFKRCSAVFDAEGRFRPVYDEATTLDLPADTAILAIGQTLDTGLPAPWTDCCSGIPHDPVTLQTRNAKVIVAGDLSRGPTSIVEAMAQGKEAALSAVRLVTGEDLYYERQNGAPYETGFEADWSRANRSPRTPMEKIPLSERKGFREVATGYSPEEAMAEAERCLNCGIPVGHRTCWFCLPCEIECPEEALYVEIPYLLR